MNTHTQVIHLILQSFQPKYGIKKKSDNDVSNRMRSQSQLSGLKHKRREDPELRKLSEFGSVCRAEKTGVLALSSLPFFTRGWNGFGIFLRTFESVKLLFLAGIYLLFSRLFKCLLVTYSIFRTVYYW